MLLGLAAVGLDRGWLKSVHDLPMFGGAEKEEEEHRDSSADSPAGGGAADVGSGPNVVHHPPASNPADPLPKEVKHSSKAVDDLRRSCEINMHMSAKILGTVSIRMLVGMSLSMVHLARESFGRMLAGAKTQQGCVSWWASMANGEWVAELAGLGSPENLQLARYSTTPDEADTPDDELVARYHFELMVSILGCRLVTLTLFTGTLSDFFGALLHSDGEVVRSCLMALSRWWSKLQELEAAAKGNTFFKKFAEQLAWPLQSWCRELLVVLSEHKFNQVPAWVRDAYLLPWARGFHGANITEDAFQLLRRSEAVAETGRLGRLQRWCRLGHSELLQDYDRPPPPMTSSTRQALPSSTFFSKRLFQASACATTLTEGEVKQILRGARTPSPESFSELHFAWLAALQVASNVEQGAHLETPLLGRRLGLAGDWGFLLWQLRLQKVSGKLYCSLNGGWGRLAVRLIDRFQRVGGRADRCTNSSAGGCVGLGRRGRSRSGLVVHDQQPPGGLAFLGLQMPQLQKLLTMTGQKWGGAASDLARSLRCCCALWSTSSCPAHRTRGRRQSSSCAT